MEFFAGAMAGGLLMTIIMACFSVKAYNKGYRDCWRFCSENKKGGHKKC